jgi:hypothetical protein
MLGRNKEEENGSDCEPKNRNRLRNGQSPKNKDGSCLSDRDSQWGGWAKKDPQAQKEDQMIEVVHHAN